VKISTLDSLQPGETAVIKKILVTCGDISYMMEMGIMEGTEVTFLKSAPLGDPILVDVRGYHLSLRRDKAKSILIEKTSK